MYAHAVVYYTTFHFILYKYIAVHTMIISSPLLKYLHIHLCVCVCIYCSFVTMWLFILKMALDCYYYCCRSCRCGYCCGCTSSKIFFTFYSAFLSHELCESLLARALAHLLLSPYMLQYAYVHTYAYSIVPGLMIYMHILLCAHSTFL